MIHLVNISMSYLVEHRTKRVIRPTNLRLPVNKQRIAVLGAAGAGKSVLVRLISGADAPTTARVIRKCTISWPFGPGHSGGIHSIFCQAPDRRLFRRRLPFDKTAGLVPDIEAEFSCCPASGLTV
jgi:capsular polysaccharide transport system ATP-binding protein